jgi:hypothetical protein
MIKNVKEYVQMPLLYNHWYVAGTTEEFTNEPKGRTPLEHAIVFYRTEAGTSGSLFTQVLSSISKQSHQ